MHDDGHIKDHKFHLVKKMAKRTSSALAWNLLRHCHQVWATKQEDLFLNRIALLFHAFKKLLTSNNKSQQGAIMYGHRHFSFKATPIIHVKMHRPSSPLCFRIPCIKPHKGFDDDKEDDFCTKDYHDISNTLHGDSVEEQMNDDGIHSKAEEFIAKFYEQMKLQCRD